MPLQGAASRLVSAPCRPFFGSVSLLSGVWLRPLKSSLGSLSPGNSSPYLSYGDGCSRGWRGEGRGPYFKKRKRMDVFSRTPDARYSGRKPLPSRNARRSVPPPPWGGPATAALRGAVFSRAWAIQPSRDCDSDSPRENANRARILRSSFAAALISDCSRFRSHLRHSQAIEPAFIFFGFDLSRAGPGPRKAPPFAFATTRLTMEPTGGKSTQAGVCT